MPTGEIIAIGTELLLGEIQDTNTAYLARVFRDLGIDLYRATIIGDNVERISQAIQEALERSQILITTGGLGPTVDDPTRAAVAHAFDVSLEFHSELWEQIQERFRRYGRTPTENNRRQAFLPHGSIMIDNPVGTAPAFYYETGNKLVISLPGVPREMETILQRTVIPLLRQRFELKTIIKAYLLHAAGIGESQIDEWIGDLEMQANPTVGLSAHPGIIDIRITAKASSHDEADRMIAQTAAEIRRRVGVAIFGAQNETLEQVIFQKLATHNWRLVVLECGLAGAISNRMIKAGISPADTQSMDQRCEMKELEARLLSFQQKNRAHVALAAGYYPGPVQQNLSLLLATPNGFHSATRSFGGPPENGLIWAGNMALDFLRRNIP